MIAYHDIPEADHLGDTEHLRVHITRCAPTDQHGGRIVATAFHRDETNISGVIVCVLVESTKYMGPGRIEYITPHRYAAELTTYLNDHFGPLVQPGAAT